MFDCDCLTQTALLKPMKSLCAAVHDVSFSLRSPLSFDLQAICSWRVLLRRRISSEACCSCMYVGSHPCTKSRISCIFAWSSSCPSRISTSTVLFNSVDMLDRISKETLSRETPCSAKLRTSCSREVAVTRLFIEMLSTRLAEFPFACTCRSTGPVMLVCPAAPSNISINEKRIADIFGRDLKRIDWQHKSFTAERQSQN
mmetsp:Transcript_132921/g.284105  ORF Transcript_132921/g.284105 Transcript_132921/m.284105 type:complete len:200 (+) Transcript_132921:511-1110(+)